MNLAGFPIPLPQAWQAQTPLLPSLEGMQTIDFIAVPPTLLNEESLPLLTT